MDNTSDGYLPSPPLSSQLFLVFLRGAACGEPPRASILLAFLLVNVRRQAALDCLVWTSPVQSLRSTAFQSSPPPFHSLSDPLMGTKADGLSTYPSPSLLISSQCP
ncbi:unnamed protein product [Arctogadus glacialis]